MASRAAVTGAVLGVLFGFSGRAVAQAPVQRSGSDVGVALRFGTLGVGVEVSKWLVKHVGARVGGTFFDVKFKDRSVKDIHYDIDVKVHAATALLDLYPGARGAFHLTAGFSSNPAKLTLTGQSTNGKYTINDTTYNASDVGTLTGTGKFPGVAPYLGLGFGTAARGGRLAFLFDLGFDFGKPKIALTSVGGAKSNDPRLQSHLNAQIASTQDDVNKIPGYPVLSLGLMYRF